MAQRLEQASESAFLEAYGDVSSAVEAGAGLPAVARAAERALDASLAIVDVSGSVLAVACLSPDDERAVLSGGPGRETRELRVEGPKGKLSVPVPRGVRVEQNNGTLNISKAKRIQYTCRPYVWLWKCSG